MAVTSHSCGWCIVGDIPSSDTLWTSEKGKPHTAACPWRTNYSSCLPHSLSMKQMQGLNKISGEGENKVQPIEASQLHQFVDQLTVRRRAVTYRRYSLVGGFPCS